MNVNKKLIKKNTDKKKHVKKCSISLVFREVQIKTTEHIRMNMKDRKACHAAVHRVAKSQAQLSD